MLQNQRRFLTLACILQRIGFAVFVSTEQACEIELVRISYTA